MSNENTFTLVVKRPEVWYNFKKGRDFLEYLITFLQGIISFISPCMLPMLPIYISYFSGEKYEKSKAFISSLAFVFGFTLVFCMLGMFAGSLGVALGKFHEYVEIVGGIIIIILGLNFLGIINVQLFKGIHTSHKVDGVFSAFVFGMIYSVSHLPCVGAFLGTSLATASVSGSAVKGILLLLSYSLGMGIPFMVSALLIERLKNFFAIIENNYKIINLVCGLFLVILGFSMATGIFHRLLHLI